MLDEVSDFSYNPKKYFCKKHHNLEIEYCCKINESFYCKLCVGGHVGHEDTILADISRQIQEDVIKLKHSYIAKRQQMMGKIDTH